MPREGLSASDDTPAEPSRPFDNIDHRLRRRIVYVTSARDELKRVYGLVPFRDLVPVGPAAGGVV